MGDTRVQNQAGVYDMKYDTLGVTVSLSSPFRSGPWFVVVEDTDVSVGEKFVC